MSREITNLKKRRGTVRASVTNLKNRVSELEARADIAPASRLESARQHKVKLTTHDSDFRKHHFELIDLLESTDDLDREQRVLDEHDDIVTSLFTRLECVINDHTGTTLPSAPAREVFKKRMHQLQNNVAAVGGPIDFNS